MSIFFFFIVYSFQSFLSYQKYFYINLNKQRFYNATQIIEDIDIRNKLLWLKKKLSIEIQSYLYFTINSTNIFSQMK
jgi:hypothetical protein